MKRKIIPWLLVILWMALIFYLSHQPANKSNGLSKGATEIMQTPPVPGKPPKKSYLSKTWLVDMRA